MRLTHRVAAVAGTLALAGLGMATPATHVGAAAPVATATPAAHAPAVPSVPATLRSQIIQRFPKANIQVNSMTGKSSKAFALVVSLVAQQGASLSGGDGARVLSWYIKAYPHQALYALYSYEKDKDGLA